jgi:hypothetical protein
VTLFQAIFAPLCACAAAAMLWRTARGRSPRRNGFFWTLVWLTAGFLILDPLVTTKIAGWLGIGRGADLLLYVAILTGLAGSFYFYVKHRRLEVMVTEIIRREALRSAVQGTRTTQVAADRPATASQSREAEPFPRAVERS